MSTEMEATLSGDELSLALTGVQHALAWWKKQPRSDFGREEVKRLDALNKKLSAICDFAYPYEIADDMPDKAGSEPIMGFNREIVARTRQTAQRARHARTA